MYEGHEAFSVLPTFGVLPALRACFEQVTEGLPGIAIDLSMVRGGVLHIQFKTQTFFHIVEPFNGDDLMPGQFLGRDRKEI